MTEILLLFIKTRPRALRLGKSLEPFEYRSLVLGTIEDKSLGIRAVCPQNGTGVLKG